MANTKVSLKLLVGTATNKVLFAEAGKEFVDFLFHLLSLPLGTIVKLLNVDGMVGSLGTLYKSIESLSSDYLQINKDAVLKPRAAVNVPLLKLSDSPTRNKFYACGNKYCFGHVAKDSSSICPLCSGSMSSELTLVVPGSCMNIATSSGVEVEGYVKGLVTYMVMDNLEIEPLSTISGITLMHKFQIKDISSLIEKEVEVGLKEGLQILKASMEISDTVLTTVFLSKKVQKRKAEALHRKKKSRRTKS